MKVITCGCGTIQFSTISHVSKVVVKCISFFASCESFFFLFFCFSLSFSCLFLQSLCIVISLHSSRAASFASVTSPVWIFLITLTQCLISNTYHDYYVNPPFQYSFIKVATRGASVPTKPNPIKVCFQATGQVWFQVPATKYTLSII